MDATSPLKNTISATDYAELLTRHDYALVNKPSLEPEPWHDTFPLVPIAPEILSGDLDKVPALLDLKSLDAPLTTRLIENLHAAQTGGEERLISALLAVAPGTQTERVHKHLENRLVMYRARPHGQFMLRYQDPRVFVHFRRVLNEPLIRAMYGPVRVWTIPFQNEWLELPALEDGPRREYWCANPQQADAMGRIGHINMTLKKLKKHRGQPWRDLAEFLEAAEKADRALIVAARELNPEFTPDWVAFAFHSFIYGENFYRHPRVQQLLDEARNDKHFGYAGGAITTISPEEWAAITTHQLSNSR
jgi:hypothetical protein